MPPFCSFFSFFFPFTPFSLSLFISFPLGIQKKSQSNRSSVVVWELHESPTLPLPSAFHSFKTQLCRFVSNTCQDIITPSSAFHMSGNKTRQNAARRCHQQYRSRHHESPALSLSSAFLLSYL